MIHSFEKKSSGTVDIEADNDAVYYRFAGAAIASMLLSRYEKLKEHPGDTQLSEETTIL